MFQPEAYIKQLISSQSSLENLVKVFIEVISERIDINKTLSSTLQGCSKTIVYTVVGNIIYQVALFPSNNSLHSSML